MSFQQVKEDYKEVVKGILTSLRNMEELDRGVELFLDSVEFSFDRFEVTTLDIKRDIDTELIIEHKLKSDIETLKYAIRGALTESDLLFAVSKSITGVFDIAHPCSQY